MLASASLLLAGNVSAATAVTPATGGTANPFAYALSSTEAEGTVTINYSLNTDAAAVAINLIGNQGTVVKTVELDGEYLAKGAHTTTVELAGLSDGCYNWEVKVSGEAKTEVKEFVDYRFYHPRGVDVDNNMESPAFGNIYVTEGMVTTSSTYWSGTRGGNGLYIFTPDMEGVKNEVTGNYAFMGGFTVDQKVASGSVTNGADLARVRVAEDGRIFVTRCNDSGAYIAVVKDAATLIKEDKFTSLLGEGSVDASSYAFNDASGNFIAGPNIGFDVKGSGDDLKIMAISAQSQLWSYNWAGSRIDEYSLGNASTLPAPVQQSVLTKATTAPQTTNVEYDNRGGFWYCQSRQNPTETNVGLAYVDADGNIKYTDIVPRGGGGIKLSPDYSQIAIASNYAGNTAGTSTFSVYDITWAEDGTPTLTEIYTITHGIGTNCYDIAWDLANNIYICGNSKEHLKGFSIPRADNNFTTKAAAQYAICYTAPVVPTADPLYITGENVGGNWDPANADEFEFDGEKYILTVTEATTQFKISTTKGSWDEFNAGNLATDAAITNGGTVNLSVNKDAGNIVLPWAGVWTITVAADLSTLTATTETPEPAPSYDPLYMVGYNNGWDPANPTEIPYDAEKGAYYLAGVEFSNTTCKISRTKGSWDDFNAGGICSSNDAVIKIGTPCSLYLQYCGDIVIERAGTYNLTIDMVNATMLLEEVVVYPEALFLCGNLKDANWDPTYDGAILDQVEDGVYTIESVELVAVDGNDNAYFSFNTTTGSWGDVNTAARYGADATDKAVALGENMTVVNGGTNPNAWMVEPGMYKMTVSLKDMVLIVTKITDGIENIEADDNNAPAVYYNLQGVEVANPENGGIYIKKQGNKATKVVK